MMGLANPRGMQNLKSLASAVVEIREPHNLGELL